MSKAKPTADWIPDMEAESIEPKMEKPTTTTKTRERSRKTFYLRTKTIDEIQELAEEKGIGASQLTDFLLAHCLDQLAKGDLKLPLKKRTVTELEY